MVTYYGMLFSSVGANNENSIGTFYFLYGIGHSSATEGCSQTGYGGRMSKAGAIIYVIGANNLPHEFLHQVVFFIGALGGT